MRRTLVGSFCSSPGTAAEALFAAFGRPSQELEMCAFPPAVLPAVGLCVFCDSARCQMMCFVFITCPVAHARLLETAVCCVL